MDGSGKNGSFVAGRAYDNGKVPASESTHFLDCGCHRDEALLELFVYKVVRARSHHPKLKHHEESLGKDVFLTRPRTFLVQGLLCAVGLTVHDLYTGEMTELGSVDYRVKILSHVVERWGVTKDREDGEPDMELRLVLVPKGSQLMVVPNNFGPGNTAEGGELY